MNRPFGTLPPIKRNEENDQYVVCVTIANFLNTEELNRVTDIWDEDKSTILGAYTHNVAETSNIANRAKQVFINPDQHGWLYDKIGMACIMANASRFKFEITGYREPMRLLSYSPGNQSKWHTDYGPSKKSSRKLVVLIQLSAEEEYTGADLEILQADVNKKIIKQKGTAIILPAYVAHMVSPLLSGNRKSLVATISGPPFV